METLTRPASGEELPGLWAAICGSHLFDSYDRFASWWGDGPWRVRVTGQEEAAVLGRWRRHLDYLSVRGLWCAARRVPLLLEDLRRVAAENGFSRLLGPLVPEEEAGLYLRGGMTLAHHIVVCRLRPIRPGSWVLPGSTAVRPGRDFEVPEVLRVDQACFDDFWRLDEDEIDLHASGQRLAVAERDGHLIGYTLSTVQAGEMTIGRLGVLPAERRCGVGSALIAEAVAHGAETGVSAVTLCTQETNLPARRLYRKAGFRELSGRLVGTISPPLAG